ncbi:hypothetical protein IEO21_00230 [Rhodonia placenta]|uniref:SET domain-containing protein n=1 Tax=Rhodonia placenta TaxID=104341 RepID=A0A8H7U6J8_9APHY|nr:hypothetical protein IEO21_00230 [Postia placenta]
MARNSRNAKTAASIAQPAHWPTHVQYISVYRFHLSVPTETRALICPKSTAPEACVPSRSLTIIRRISEHSHPACGQFGLFAARKIPPRTHILDYIGELHCDDRPESDYDLSLYRTREGLSIGVDAQHMGNEARFVNDFRGISHKPNAVFEDRRTVDGELRMSIWSGSDCIKKGDEILVSYGKSWWRAREECEGNA